MLFNSFSTKNTPNLVLTNNNYNANSIDINNDNFTNNYTNANNNSTSNNRNSLLNNSPSISSSLAIYKDSINLSKNLSTSRKQLN